MKKLLFALTLVLCLAISMVAFTSCNGTGNGEGEGETCEHTWATEATIVKEATCTEAGASAIKCLSCGDVKEGSEETIPATGHSYTTDSYTAPTCAADGTEAKICANCGDNTTTTIPATGEHTWDAYPTVDVEPTCTTDGSQSIKCTGCNEQKPDSVEVIEAAHIWGVIPTVDVEPTCTEAGSQSYKCIFCNGKMEGSDEVVPATGHADLPIVTAPTVFSDGLAEGTCSVCNTAASVVLPKTEANVNILTPSTGEILNYIYFSEILGEDDHFYPTEENPNGKSLYLEFSFLWNETLANTQPGEGYVVFGRFQGQTSGSFQPMWLSFIDGIGGGDPGWCNVAGGFDLGNAIEYGNIYGPCRAGEDGAVFAPIGEYGWHRIGLKYTQVTEAGAPGNMIVEIYINGELVSSYYFDCTSNCLLYYDNGDGTYTDNSFAKFAYFHIRKSATTGENAYFIIADESVSTDGFVMNVKPLTTPIDGTYTAEDGKVIDADVYFTLSDGSDDSEGGEVVDPNPGDSEDNTDPNPGNPGDSEDNTDPNPGNPGDSEDSDDSEDAGTICEHEGLEYSVTTAPTVFSEGIISGTCPDCGETLTDTLPNAIAEAEEIFTASERSLVQKYLSYGEILGEDQHFYPTEENPSGQSLYVEFSFLWNETLTGVTGQDGDYVLLGRLEGSSSGSFSPSWFAFKGGSDPTWATAPGEFEAANTIQGANIYGPLMSGESGADCPSIGEYGWHRIGLVYTQLVGEALAEAPNNANMTVSLYVDGVLISTYYCESSSKCLLYTDNGDGTYTDNVEAKLNYYFLRKAKSTADNGYLIIDDMTATVGGWAKEVKKLDTAIDGTYTTADGTELDADLYFRFATNADDSEDAGASEDAGNNGGASEDASDSEDAA